jgi:lysozyme
MTNKTRLLTILFVAVMLILGTMIIRRLLFTAGGRAIDKHKYPVTGIDISGHTGKIDFIKISQQKIDFVYIKATEGKTFVDRNFEQNYLNSRLSIVPVGFYHFFRFNRDGKDQAENFLNSIRGKKTLLPLVVDVEEWGNVTIKSRKKVISELQTFIRLIELRTGKRLMIYANESSYEKYIMDNFEKNELWICSFNIIPNIDKKWTFWQHSHQGKYEGAIGMVDINTFNGSKEEWAKYLKGLKTANTEINTIGSRK